MPLLEARHAEQLGPVRDTLSRLQMVYAQNAGGPRAAAATPGPEPAAGSEPAAPDEGASEPPKPGEPGPAQRSGRLWIPGQ